MKAYYFLFLLIIFLSCNNNNSPTEPQNNAPVINNILQNTPNITVNTWVTLTAIATDADGDSLSYFWSCSAGIIKDYKTDTNPTEWRSPDVAGEYTVNCTVSDGKETDSKSITITVN